MDSQFGTACREGGSAAPGRRSRSSSAAYAHDHLAAGGACLGRTASCSCSPGARCSSRNLRLGTGTPQRGTAGTWKAGREPHAVSSLSCSIGCQPGRHRCQNGSPLNMAAFFESPPHLALQYAGNPLAAGQRRHDHELRGRIGELEIVDYIAELCPREGSQIIVDACRCEGGGGTSSRARRLHTAKRHAVASSCGVEAYR